MEKGGNVLVAVFLTTQQANIQYHPESLVISPRWHASETALIVKVRGL